MPAPRPKVLIIDDEEGIRSSLKMIFEYEGYGQHKLVAGSTVYQPPGIKHKEIDHSDDFEVLEITMPAEFETATAG